MPIKYNNWEYLWKTLSIVIFEIFFYNIIQYPHCWPLEYHMGIHFRCENLPHVIRKLKNPLFFQISYIMSFVKKTSFKTSSRFICVQNCLLTQYTV